METITIKSAFGVFHLYWRVDEGEWLSLVTEQGYSGQVIKPLAGPTENSWIRAEIPAMIEE